MGVTWAPVAWVAWAPTATTETFPNSSQAKQRLTNANQAKLSQTKPNQAKPKLAMSKLSQTKPNQAKPKLATSIFSCVDLVNRMPLSSVYKTAHQMLHLECVGAPQTTYISLHSKGARGMRGTRREDKRSTTDKKRGHGRDGSCNLRVAPLLWFNVRFKNDGKPRT